MFKCTCKYCICKQDTYIVSRLTLALPIKDFAQEVLRALFT